MTNQDLHAQLLSLSSAEKLEVIQTLSHYDYPTRSATDLANAWVYASANQDEIEAAIRDNEAA